MVTPQKDRTRKPFYRSLIFWTLAGVVLGILVGALWPPFATLLEPLGTVFVNLVKMIIAPLVFCVVVTGIANAGDLAVLRRIGIKALVYFEAVSLIALCVGLAFAVWMRPGSGMGVDPSTLDTSQVDEAATQNTGVADFLIGIVPESVMEAFAQNDILQVLFFAVLFGIALLLFGPRAAPLIKGITLVQDIILRIVSGIMVLAPVATFAVTAYTIGEYGLSALSQFGALLGVFYLALTAFLVVLGAVVRLATGVGLLRVMGYMKNEIVTGALVGSSEAVMPQLIRKLEHAGAGRSVVGLVIPTGYSFNLDGAAIYLSVSAVFLAHATGTELSVADLVMIVGVAMLTSHGMAGVAGSAFVTLTVTIGTVGAIPVAAAALILAPDRFMGKGRTAVNIIGNVVATLIVARWTGELDRRRLRDVVTGKIEDDSPLPNETHRTPPPGHGHDQTTVGSAASTHEGHESFPISTRR
ncbi:cation:dicarboxylate symporter family transporter [Corynebacterium glyciniphilum]|uniref:cation:dicarboxylate symporter family transporter n=1 Tax=Corynebacterium glyciniphilum TaxID=1404244 RepID=UPI002356CC52